ncbi:DNA cytosine methyltransferase [Nocardioides bruguierae]|uniref:DNA cytosine methyltransferase n=1 Tax=Nocardioides bruguierae TaxID=2945102 RepID=UPI002020CC82|nr:DNA cytosine methyltransferase [Nocardioides bruguierae]MCL8025036.1 DNA cytosine methyltransferase [Nocardioides bruguierae]
MNARPTLLDVFAGCGGMTRGFKDAGFDPIFAVEFDRAAAATYAANFGDHIHAGDIADVSPEQIPPVDVMVGGPPCQGFSALGLRNVDDPRNDLWREYLRFVGTAHPKVFVLENVQRFRRSPQHQMLLDEAQGGSLQEYTLTSAVVVASDYGVAQKRPRTIVIGSRIGRIDVPAPTHSREPGLGTVRWEGVRSRIEPLMDTPTRAELPSATPSRSPARSARSPPHG